MVFVILIEMEGNSNFVEEFEIRFEGLSQSMNIDEAFGAQNTMDDNWRDEWAIISMNSHGC